MKLILSACAISLVSARTTYECLETCDHLGSTPSCCVVSPGLSDDVVCCETDRHCVQGTNGLNYCTAFHYSCQSGQGQLGASLASRNLNDPDECGLFCDENPNCIAFDYTTRSQGDACRLYAASNIPRLEVGIHTRQYCVAWEFSDPQPTQTNGEIYHGHDHVTETEVEHHYDCVVGQGERRASIDSANINSEAGCEAACDANAFCEAFDYTTSSQGDACRLYAANTPRLGSGGGDNRMYCEHHDGDHEETEVTEPETDGDYDCVVGQGERRASISSGNNNNEAACASVCDANAACLAFDYTTRSQGDACRLYAANTPRIGNGGGDNRMYCVGS